MAAPAVQYDTTFRATIAPFRIPVATADVDRNIFIGIDGAKCGAGAPSVGVSKSKGVLASGDEIEVYDSGYVPVQCGGNVAFGDDVVSDANGCAVKATVLSASTPATGSTPVLSGSAQPAMTVAGSTLPQKILGRAWSDGSTTKLCLVKLNLAGA
jgi:hypothetical protein